MLQRTSVLLSTGILASLFWLTGCNGSSPAPSVTVTASATTVDGTDSITLTAAVTNDQSSKGVTWSLTGAGALSGQTTTSATYTAPAATSSAQSVTVTATSVASTSKTGAATITIPAVPAVASTSSGLAGTVGATYSVQLQASGGISPYTWTLAGGTLPACLTLQSNGNIVATSGSALTASCAGTYSNLTFTATDSGVATALSATSSALSIVIAPAPAITFNTATLPAGTVGTSYSGSVSALGGVGTLSYEVTAGSLPAGLTMTSGGAISGKPTTPGTSNFFVAASDAFGDPAVTSAQFSITVSYGALSITTTNISSAVLSQNYTQTFHASGGSGNYSWSLTTGQSGLTGIGVSLSVGGVLSGSPTSTGSYPFTVQVTDTATTNTITAPYTLVVNSTAASCSSNGSQNSILNGNYAFLLSGFDPNGNTYQMIGDFKANGSGVISNGNGDANSSGFATAGEQQYTFSGTYVAGDAASDDRGTTAWTNTNTTGTTLPATTTYCFTADTVTSGVAQSGRIIEADGSGFVLTGFFESQSSSSFTNTAFSTGYAFGIQGVNEGSGGTERAAIIGQLVFNGSGGITSGQVDISQYNSTSGSTNYQAAQSNGSSSTYSISASGRGTMTLGSTPFVVYVVGAANKLLMLSADNINTGTLLVGQAIQQTTTSYTAATLNGSSVFRQSGAQAGSPTTDDVGVGQVKFNGSGGISGVNDGNEGGILSGPSAISGNYTVNSIGYVQLSGAGNHPPSFYLYAPGSGFGLDGSGSVGLFYLSAQTVPSGGFTSADLTGSFAIGTIAPSAYDITAGSNNYPQILEGAITLSGASGVLTGTSDNLNAPGLSADLQLNNSISNTYTLDPTYGATTGRFVISNSGSPNVVGYMVSPTQVFLIQAQTGQDGLTVEADGQQ